MQIFDYYRGGEKPVVVVLGFFDCMHVGHAELLRRGVQMAKNSKADCVLFTFSTAKNDCETAKTVYTLEERLCRMQQLGASGAIVAPFDKGFRATLPTAFLDGLFARFSVVGVVCGDDYRYGQGAKGNAETLALYCAEKGVPLEVVEEITCDGVRVSTSRILQYLEGGDIARANRLLGESFRLTGAVVGGRKVGRTLGFPTANVVADPCKKLPKEGVYLATAVVNDRSYHALAHVGSRPTYGLKERVVEVWLDGFDGDLYGKTMTVYFDEFVREIHTFSSQEQLIEQIQKDKALLRKRGKADD